ncbi:MAG TPA: hypothetical protein VGX76_08710, partial [Pirellulales bacterium]|nr:hypothetical protein [Pirellulales bacterium]
ANVAFDRQADETARERRVDEPRQQDEMVAPPHATPRSGGRPVRASAADLPSPPLGDGTAPSAEVAGPAALVETRPLTGDTRFVDRPQRSLEERVAAVELDLAAQRDLATARAARGDSELIALRHELERLEAALRQERDAHRDHRAQVAELRERVLREMSQIGEQTQLLRQARDARPSDGSLARLADDTVRRCAEIERNLREGLQSASDKLATVEGTMIAKMAELRSRQDRLGERRSPVADDSDNVLSAEPPAGAWEGSDDSQSQEVLAGVESASDEAPKASYSRWRSDDPEEIAVEPPAAREGRASEGPADDGSPQWLLGEEFTHRLVDLKAKRERSAWRHRLLWTGVAVASALLIVLTASLLRFWLHPNRSGESGAALSQQEENSQQEKKSQQQESEPAAPKAD